MKRIRKHTTFAMRWVAIAGLMAFAAQPALAQIKHPGAIVTKQRTFNGEIRWKAASQVYEMTSGGVTVEIPLRDIVSIKLNQEPPGLAQALAAVKSQPAAAIPTLEKVKNDYVNLVYDKVAGRALIQAYLALGQADKAISMAETLLRESPLAKQDGELMGAYVEALIKAEQYAKAQRMLQDIIATGDRQAVAIAQMRRGDIDMARGDMREALLNGYLRTIVFFQNVKSVQPEALAKAIKCHTALNEHHYAEKWRKRLVSGYGDSKYAREISN